MTSSVKVSVGTVKANLPAGVSAGVLRFIVLAADGVTIVATQDEDTAASTTFAALDDGSYSASVQRLDSTGAALGEAITGTFVLPVVPVVIPDQFDAPNGALSFDVTTN